MLGSSRRISKSERSGKTGVRSRGWGPVSWSSERKPRDGSLLVATAGKKGCSEAGHGSGPVVFSMLTAPRIWEHHETGPQFPDLSHPLNLGGRKKGSFRGDKCAPFERALCSSWHLCIAGPFLALVIAHFNLCCLYARIDYAQCRSRME